MWEVDSGNQIAIMSIESILSTEHQLLKKEDQIVTTTCVP